MKILNNVILLLFCICGFAQIKQGTITYGKLTAKEFTGDKEMIAWFMEQSLKADKIDYTLNFNDNEAYFFANPKLQSETDSSIDMATWFGGKLKYYQNETSKEYREYIDTRRTGVVIVNNPQQQVWTLLNESKIIDGYNVLKATSPYLYDCDKKSESVIITAWYAPEIPVPYGPIGYGNLPGLILELQHHKSTFFVKNIKLNLAAPPLIDKLQSEKTVSCSEFTKMLMRSLSYEQLKGIEEVDAKKK